MNSTYKCFLNGSLYGVESLNYMNELFRDYVVTREMYGSKKASFEIVKIENERKSLMSKLLVMGFDKRNTPRIVEVKEMSRNDAQKMFEVEGWKNIVFLKK